MDIRLILDGDITVVSLSGRIEIEKHHNFKKACLKNFADKKVVFCMKNISFVGSSGIQSFFNLLNELNIDQAMQVKISGLPEDFMRLFTFSALPNLEVHENIEKAIQSFAFESLHCMQDFVEKSTSTNVHDFIEGAESLATEGQNPEATDKDFV